MGQEKPLAESLEEVGLLEHLFPGLPAAGLDPQATPLPSPCSLNLLNRGLCEQACQVKDGFTARHAGSDPLTSHSWTSSSRPNEEPTPPKKDEICQHWCAKAGFTRSSMKGTQHSWPHRDQSASNNEHCY